QIPPGFTLDFLKHVFEILVSIIGAPALRQNNRDRLGRLVVGYFPRSAGHDKRKTWDIDINEFMLMTGFHIECGKDVKCIDVFRLCQKIGLILSIPNQELVSDLVYCFSSLCIKYPDTASQLKGMKECYEECLPGMLFKQIKSDIMCSINQYNPENTRILYADKETAKRIMASCNFDFVWHNNLHDFTGDREKIYQIISAGAGASNALLDDVISRFRENEGLEIQFSLLNRFRNS